MKHLLTISFLLFALAHASGQVNNIYANAGIAQTIGPPTFVPGARGSVVAIDTLTGLWYVNPNRCQTPAQRLKFICGTAVHGIVSIAQAAGRQTCLGQKSARLYTA